MRKVALRFLVPVVAIVSAMTVTGSGHAHDLWLTAEGGAKARRVVVNYGHPRDRPPTAADKILDLVAITGDQRVSLLDGLEPATVRGAPVVRSRPFADAGRTLLAARYDNGYWVKIGDNLYRNVSKRMAPNAIDSLWSAKFAKSVTGAGAPWNTCSATSSSSCPWPIPRRRGRARRCACGCCSAASRSPVPRSSAATASRR